MELGELSAIGKEKMQLEILKTNILEGRDELVIREAKRVEMGDKGGERTGEGGLIDIRVSSASFRASSANQSVSKRLHRTADR